jgi:mannose-6-phosphate isomerase-like protein (cupin superfamily)
VTGLPKLRRRRLRGGRNASAGVPVGHLVRDERPDLYVVDRNQLPAGGFSRELEGADHGGVGISIIFVDAEPGQGPALHKHEYDEIFIVQEGEAAMTVGTEERIVKAGEIAVVPAGQPHRFVNSGAGRLRQIDIHLSPRFATEWLSR